MPPQRTKKVRHAQDSSVSDRHNKRGPWSTPEDDLLKQLVDEKGAGKWVQIASALEYRSPKQCRERWHQNLKPELNHEPISEEEGKFIEREVATVGKKWAEIARRMVNRSDNAVKNWWNGGENRRKRELARAQESRHMMYTSHVAHHQYYDSRPHAAEYRTLPPLQPPSHDMRIAIPEASRRLESGSPSPLSGKPPSLISDAGTEPSMTRGYHSHRSSFNSSIHQFGQPYDMGRTYSNESWGSPGHPYQRYRDSRYEENSPVVREDVVYGNKTLPSFDNLNNNSPYPQEILTPAGCRPFPEAAPASASFRVAQAGTALPPLRSIDPNPTGPSQTVLDDSKAKMSVQSLLG
ncbi:hypothetical protein MMC10_005495 [Thelotrema lepadinum]|nr:hypothetical protein [Thelotrema lepadinum]